MATPIRSNAYKTERRKARRTEPIQPIEGVDLKTGVTVRLRDFSTRSFAVESPDPMTDRRTREFEFPMGRGHIAFKGVPKRRAKVSSFGDEPQYLVAFEFTYGSQTGRMAVEYFVRSLRGQVA